MTIIIKIEIIIIIIIIIIRGLMQLEETYIIEITKLMEYVDTTEDPLIQTV
jgi:hypothetical protein